MSLEEIARLYQSGLTLKQIAEQAGCSTNTVRNRMVTAGIQRRCRGGSRPGSQPRLKAARNEAIRRAREQGATLRKLAEQHGVSIQRIHEITHQ